MKKGRITEETDFDLVSIADAIDHGDLLEEIEEEDDGSSISPTSRIATINANSIPGDIDPVKECDRAATEIAGNAMGTMRKRKKSAKHKPS